MSRQKQAGTREETRVVDWLKAHGWPEARRIAPGGTSDKGDVQWTDGVVIEVKHRRTTTSNAGLGQPGTIELAGWMAELEAERKNAGARLGWLIVKRSGTTDVGQWWAYCTVDDFASQVGGWLVSSTIRHSPICMTVATAAGLMADALNREVPDGTPVPTPLPELREPAA